MIRAQDARRRRERLELDVATHLLIAVGCPRPLTDWPPLARLLYRKPRIDCVGWKLLHDTRQER